MAFENSFLSVATQEMKATLPVGPQGKIVCLYLEMYYFFDQLYYSSNLRCNNIRPLSHSQDNINNYDFVLFRNSFRCQPI